MNVASSLFYLIKTSDCFTQCIVYILLIVSFFVFACFIYAFFILRFKIKECIKFYFLLKEHDDLKIKEFLSHHSLKSFFQIISDTSIKNELSCYLYIKNEQNIINFLVISASSSPLVGLLGTIWGIIHAFLGMADNIGDLSSIAPGIAEALVTTLAGLLVAIPALIFQQILKVQRQSFLYYVALIIEQKKGQNNE